MATIDYAPEDELVLSSLESYAANIYRPQAIHTDIRIEFRRIFKIL